MEKDIYQLIIWPKDELKKLDITYELKHPIKYYRMSCVKDEKDYMKCDLLYDDEKSEVEHTFAMSKKRYKLFKSLLFDNVDVTVDNFIKKTYLGFDLFAKEITQEFIKDLLLFPDPDEVKAPDLARWMSSFNIDGLVTSSSLKYELVDLQPMIQGYLKPDYKKDELEEHLTDAGVDYIENYNFFELYKPFENFARIVGYNDDSHDLCKMNRKYNLKLLKFALN